MRIIATGARVNAVAFFSGSCGIGVGGPRWTGFMQPMNPFLSKLPGPKHEDERGLRVPRLEGEGEAGMGGAE
ncbi:MAG: hypothetical protein EA425_04400 [Puniceicoccaceae bacterium]|nr:MAG: hypothetical protein EA425_04400 [Puniceicoccaceae bacterium]